MKRVLIVLLLIMSFYDIAFCYYLEKGSRSRQEQLKDEFIHYDVIFIGKLISVDEGKNYGFKQSGGMEYKSFDTLFEVSKVLKGPDQKSFKLRSTWGYEEDNGDCKLTRDKEYLVFAKLKDGVYYFLICFTQPLSKYDEDDLKLLEAQSQNLKRGF